MKNSKALKLGMLLIVMMIAMKAKASVTETTPDPRSNPICYDVNGQFDSDLGTDDMDCGN